MNAKTPQGPYRVGQVAEMLGVHVDTIRDWCRNGKLAAIVTPGGHRRITADAVDACVRRLTATSLAA